MSCTLENASTSMACKAIKGRGNDQGECGRQIHPTVLLHLNRLHASAAPPYLDFACTTTCRTCIKLVGELLVRGMVRLKTVYSNYRSPEDSNNLADDKISVATSYAEAGPRSLLARSRGLETESGCSYFSPRCGYQLSKLCAKQGSSAIRCAVLCVNRPAISLSGPSSMPVPQLVMVKSRVHEAT